jgi:hypothetical protein
VTDDDYVSVELSEAQKSSPGAIRVEVTNGKIERCFSDIKLKVEPVTSRTAYTGAEGFAIGVAVSGDQIAGVGSGNLSDALVRVDLEVSGKALPVEFDATSNTFVGQWRKIEDDLNVSATATFLLTGQRFEATPWTISASDVPPTPTVSWIGDFLVEGEASSEGNLVFSSGFNTDNGEYCVTIGEPSLVESKSGMRTGNLKLSETSKCGQVKSQLKFPVSMEFNSVDNRTSVLRVSYNSTYQPSNGQEVTLEPGEVEIGPFQVVKGANNVAGIAFAFLLASLTTLLSYSLLFVSALRQGRLPDPKNMLVGKADIQVSREGEDARLVLVEHFQLRDLTSPRGDRNRFRIDTVNVVRIAPLNPFRQLRAKFGVEEGTLVVRRLKGTPKRDAVVSVPFNQTAFAHISQGAGTMYIALPLGSDVRSFSAEAKAFLVELEREHKGVFLSSQQIESADTISRPRSGPPSFDKVRPPQTEVQDLNRKDDSSSTSRSRRFNPPKPPTKPSRTSERTVKPPSLGNSPSSSRRFNPPGPPGK